MKCYFFKIILKEKPAWIQSHLKYSTWRIDLVSLPLSNISFSWVNHSQIQSSLESPANKGFGGFVCLFVLYCNLSQSQLKYITGKHLKHYYWKKTGSVWSHPPHTSKIHSPLFLNVYFTHSRNSIEGTKYAHK